MSKSTNKPQRRFFREINKWIQEGCPPNKTFSPLVWLCYNYNMWCIDNGKTNRWNDGKASFIDLGYKSNINPFNSDIASMLEEAKQRTIYKNPQRLEFINKWK